MDIDSKNVNAVFDTLQPPTHAQSPRGEISEAIIGGSMLPLVRYACCEKVLGKFDAEAFRALFSRIAASATEARKIAFFKLLLDCAVYNGLPILDFYYVDSAKSLVVDSAELALGVTRQELEVFDYLDVARCSVCERNVSCLRFRVSAPVSKLIRFMDQHDEYAKASIGVVPRVLDTNPWILSTRSDDVFYYMKRDELARFPVYHAGHTSGYDLWVTRLVSDANGIAVYDTGLSLRMPRHVDFQIVPIDETARKHNHLFIETVSMLNNTSHIDLALAFAKIRKTPCLQLPHKVARLVFRKRLCAPFKIIKIRSLNNQ